MNQFQRVWSEIYLMDQKIFAIGCPMMWKKFKVLKLEQVMLDRKWGGKKYPKKTGTS